MQVVTSMVPMQRKADLSDEQGQRVKGILKDLLSEKFVKYLYFYDGREKGTFNPEQDLPE